MREAGSLHGCLRYSDLYTSLSVIRPMSTKYNSRMPSLFQLDTFKDYGDYANIVNDSRNALHAQAEDEDTSEASDEDSDSDSGE